MSVREKIRDKYSNQGKKKPTSDGTLIPSQEDKPMPDGGASIEDLRPAAYNPRIISPEKLEMLRKAMAEYGDLSGVVFNIRTGQLVGGHQRVKHFDPAWPIHKEPYYDQTGTVALGYIETPDGRWTYREVDWDHKKEMAANIAANKHGGDWDEDLLDQILLDLYQTGLEMPLTGFTDEELKERLGLGEEETDLGEEDPVVEPVEDPIVKRGDLWVCHQHRLLCGDSTNLDDVDKLMAGDKADLVWTDPPYNVNYESKAGKIENDNMSTEAFLQFLKDTFTSMHFALKPGGCFYIAHAEGNNIGDTFRSAVNSIDGLLMKQCLVWVKNCAVLGRQDYNWKHEPILYGWKDGSAHYFNGDFTQTTVIDDDTDVSKLDKKQLMAVIKDLRNAIASSVIREDKPARSELHPTQKPVALVERNVRASSLENQVVLDLFGGSGTTMIACHKHKRQARLMEFDPRYAEAILRRFQEYAGKEPLLISQDGTATPLSEVEAMRGKASGK